MNSVISDKLIAPIVEHFTLRRQGARLKKFQASIEILRAAEARGAWEGREAQKVGAGFYQGLLSKPRLYWSQPGTPVVEPPARDFVFKAEMCLQYGHTYSGPIPYADGAAQEAIEAWFKLCWVAHVLRKELDAARPKPVVTPVGLSPKVTKTLTECGLDIDLPTIRPADIEAYELVVMKDGVQQFNKDGSPKLETHYRVKWTPGILHRQSRFAYAGGCEACGKNIPSGLFVPVEAHCKNKGLVSMWLGCDCARNIFGIKDKGIAK